MLLTKLRMQTPNSTEAPQLSNQKERKHNSNSANSNRPKHLSNHSTLPNKKASPPSGDIRASKQHCRATASGIIKLNDKGASMECGKYPDEE